MQQGRHAARVIGNRLSGRQTPPFRYRDKGGLATIGRAKAVAEIRRLGLSGLPAWLAWLLVHLFYLIGLQNRLLVLVRWMFSYVTRSGGARLIAGSEVTLARRTRHRRASQSPAMKPSTTEPRPVVKTRVPDGYRVPDRPRTRGAGLMATGSPVPRRRCSSILPLDRHGRHAAGEAAWRRVRGRPAGKWGLERDCRAPPRGPIRERPRGGGAPGVVSLL